MIRRLLPSLCVTALLVAVPLRAMGEEYPAAAPVNLSADTLSHDTLTDTFRASGNVKITWEDTVLTSDTALFDQGKGDAVAEGRVTLRKEGDTLRSDRLRINVETEQGEVTNGDLFVEQNNFHIRGEKMAKVGEEEYRLERGSFTTCDGDVPSWSFAARDLKVTLEGYAVGKHALFLLKDVPVFYVPYIVFPVKRERQSGFLFPRIGNSTKKGFTLDVPYYWAISPSQDLTVDVDMQTKRGVGLGAEYRYLRSHGSDGVMHGYGIHDTSQDRFRGNLEAKNREYVSDSVTARADVNLVTDQDFYRDFAVATGIYNREILDSSASLTKTWDNSALTGELRYVQDLEAENDRLTLQRLPTVTYTLLGRRLGTLPVSASLDSSFANFYREEGQTGQRLDIRPAVAAYAPLPGGGVTAWGGYRQRLYSATDDDRGGGTRGAGLLDAGVAVVSSFERVYSGGWGGAEKVKHSVIPDLQLGFIEEQSQESLPFFDFNDRIPGQSRIGWGVSNYFTGKFAGNGSPEYRELLHVRLSQAYTLSGERRDLLTLTDLGRPLSDLRIEARLSPAPGLSLSGDTRIEPYNVRFSTVSLAGDLRDTRGNFAGVGYQMSRGVVNYLEGRFGLNLVKPFVFNYTGRYSFDKGGFLEGYYAVEYKRQCWSLMLSFRDRPDNREVLVGFTLSGVGALGPF